MWSGSYKKATLDLALSVRFANLPPGAKLDLIRNGGGGAAQANTKVTMALQLEGGGRFVLEFPPTASLWDVLRTAESSMQQCVAMPIPPLWGGHFGEGRMAGSMMACKRHGPVDMAASFARSHSSSHTFLPSFPGRTFSRVALPMPASRPRAS